MPTPEDNAKTVNRYLEFVAQGKVDEIVELYADDATVEDPVGTEVHIGRQSVRGFYSAILQGGNETDVVTMRALGNEVAFYWSLTVKSGDAKMRVDIVSVMTFNADGKIASMKAYWTPENMTQLQ
jgi:steroid delta-isomerase